MPHVLVKVAAGHPFAARDALAGRIVYAVIDTLGSTADEVSVAIQGVPAGDWMAVVYEPEIAAQADLLVKRPGYGSLATPS